MQSIPTSGPKRIRKRLSTKQKIKIKSCHTTGGEKTSGRCRPAAVALCTTGARLQVPLAGTYPALRQRGKGRTEILQIMECVGLFSGMRMLRLFFSDGKHKNNSRILAGEIQKKSWTFTGDMV